MSTFSQFSGGGIKTIQRGTTAVSSLVDVAITTVNPSRTTVSLLGYSTTNNNASASVRVSLVDGSTLRFLSNNQNSTASWEVIEWY